MNYTAPPDKANGDIIYGVDWNGLKNGLASYLNNGGIGNSQVSSDPAERIAGSKVDLGGGIGADAHHARHEPGGGDMVRDIKFDNGLLETAKLHAARHGIGGADPLLAGTIDGAVIASGTLSDANSNPKRRRQNSFIQNVLGLTPDPKYPLVYALTNSTASPAGRCVVRNGKLYVCASGTVPHSVIEIDLATSTETVIAMAVNDVVRTLVLIGTNIYVLLGSGVANMKIKKIDINNAVTTVVDLNSGAAPNNLDTALFMTCDGAGAKLFTRASAGATVYCISVNVDGSGLVKVSHGALGANYGIAYGKRGAEEKLWFLQDATVRRINIDQTADSTQGTTAGCRRIEYDGENLIIGVTGGAVSHVVMQPWATMYSMMDIANPATIYGSLQVTDLNSDATVSYEIFDGDAMHFAGRYGGAPDVGLVSIYPLAGYRACNRSVAGGPRSPCAMGADATYLYVFHANAGAGTTVRRFLRN